MHFSKLFAHTIKISGAPHISCVQQDNVEYEHGYYPYNARQASLLSLDVLVGFWVIFSFEKDRDETLAKCSPISLITWQKFLVREEGKK